MNKNKINTAKTEQESEWDLQINSDWISFSTFKQVYTRATVLDRQQYSIPTYLYYVQCALIEYLNRNQNIKRAYQTSYEE